MPYSQEEIVFSNRDVTLAGTLTLPRTPGRHPAVVLLHGSGPLNRDQEAFGMKPFRVIADHLTERGVAVLRYDSRGVGGSSGVPLQYTLLDVFEDALAAVGYLKTRSDINRNQIGLCGHSQGGIVAPWAASRSEDVAFIVCMAGLGLPGDESHVAQMTSIARADGAEDAEIAELVDALQRTIALIRGETHEAEVKQAVTAMLEKQLASMSQDTREDAVNAQANCVVSFYKSAWFRFFIDHDPRPALERVACPVLLLFGELDTQVPAGMHSRAMVQALERGGNTDYSLITIPGANHGFQRAVTGSPSEYEGLEKEFVPGLLEHISGWILDRVDVVR